MENGRGFGAALRAQRRDRRLSLQEVSTATGISASFLAAGQTYLMQQNVETLREVYSWLLGRLATAGWHDVLIVLPYAVVTAVIVLAQRNFLEHRLHALR